MSAEIYWPFRRAPKKARQVTPETETSFHSKPSIKGRVVTRLVSLLFAEDDHTSAVREQKDDNSSAARKQKDDHALLPANRMTSSLRCREVWSVRDRKKTTTI